MERFERVRELMANILEVPADDITSRTKQENVDNWDSVQHLNLMLALEQEFGVTLDVDELSTLTSLEAILAYLESACPSN